jgi:O-methyltransferase
LVDPTEPNAYVKLDSERVEKINELLGLDIQRVEKINALVALNDERVEKINALLALNDERLEKINALLALNDERLEKINALVALNDERVGKINALLALNDERVEKINALGNIDVERVDKINTLASAIEEIKRSTQDGMLIEGRNLDFLKEPAFYNAWALAREANLEGWAGAVPDVRWRARIALWAAEIGLNLEGDFVECGVHTGLFSLTICHALEFAKLNKNFYLFDTFDGIPLAGLEGPELSRAKNSNRDYYHDVYSIAQRNFAPFPNAHLIKGALPSSLSGSPIKRIAYLSMDLNNALPERQVIEKLWDMIVPGAVILIDDYLWRGHEPQFKMWNDFALSKNAPIAPLPTGQGVIIKPQG